MGLNNSEIIAIFALVFSVITFIFSWIRTRTKGAKMEIYGVKYLRGDISTSGATYTITAERYFRNIGGVREYLIYSPKIIVYDKDGNQIAEMQNPEERCSISPGDPAYKHESFVLKKSAENWLTGEVIFNANYYDKKGEIKYPKKDSFNIEKK